MVSEQKSPGFLKELEEVDESVGSRIRLECRVSGRPKPSVTWTKDGKAIQLSSRVRIIEAYTSHTLLISRSELADAGTYAVTIFNKHGRKTSTASVYIKGSSSGSTPKQLKSTNSRMTGGSKLDKTAASRLVSGNIWTRNSSTPASGITTTAGGAPPRRRGPGFILRPKPKTVNIGESLNLKCTLLGHPKPTVTWEKDGELVDEERTDGHIRTRIDGNNYFLEIEMCGAGDGGKYAVTARNSLGKQMASAEVTIVRDTNGSSITSKNTTTTCNLTTTKPVVEISRKTIETKKDDGIRSSKMYIHTSSKLVNEMTNVPASPTGSVSSSISVQSRQSSTSSRSNCSGGEAVGKAQPIIMPIEQQEIPEIRRKSVLQAPTITRRLSSTQVLEGEELLLQCDISGDPQLELQWLRNGVEFHEDQVFVSFRNGVARLRLRDVQLRHAGEYMCVARNDAGEVKCSSRVTVKAKPIDKCPRFFKSLNDVRAVEGETLKLEAGVEANPVPEIFWSLDGQEIQDADCSFTNNIAKLVIKNVTMTSSGQYMCNAINTSGEDSVACRVRIKERKLNIRPEFTAPLSDVTLKKDATLCLRCMVTGIPEPTVNWRCNDEIIDDYEGVEVTFQDGVAALKLDKAQTDDSGVYSCVATNCEGEGMTSCNVKVEDDSQVKEEKIINSVPKFIQRFDEFLRVQEGDEITLSCAFTGCPEPLVTWTSNGKLIEDGEIVTEPGKSFLIIRKVTMGLNGPIKCSLSNKIGKSEHESRLSVRSRRAAPTIEKELPNTLEIIEGESGQMSCKVHGHPQPRVSWTRDGRSLSILTTETTYENGEATVKIRRASSRDSGKYVCTARNLSGDIQTLCQVMVKPKVVEEVKAPKFVKKLKDVELEDGQDLKLECVIEADPVATISWEVDGDSSSLDDCDTNFHNGVASLFLEDVMKEDSGYYTCIAENEAGKVSCSCRVAVKVPDNKKCEDNSEITSNGVQASTESREPTFLVQLADMTVKEGDDIKLHCQIGGTPTPQVTWLLDGEGIVEAEVKNDEEGNHELILVESLLDDEGVYTCIAENKYKRVMSSCKVTIEENGKNRGSDDVTKNQVCAPEFIRTLSNARIADGSKDFRLTCHVTGNPQPTAQWFFNDEEIVDCDDFSIVSEGKTRSLVFAEVFPEDTGSYSCIIQNAAGKAESTCTLTVEEIEGEAPNFHNKPRPITANIGEKAIFSCQVNGDPQPIITWMFNGQELSESDNIHIVGSNADNNYTNSLEIGQVTALDAGRYSVTCSNLLGNITCTVSLIVNDVKNQETKTDFRNVLKKTQVKASPGSAKESNNSDEQMDFRGVLRKKSTERTMTSSESDDSSNQEVSNLYKEALSTQVKTKALTEDERKKQKAEQLDFRSTLVRKVDPKITNQELLKARQPSQQDFRDEALKTHVLTKQIGQDEIKKMQAEQVDFRSEAIKTKVVTKAYKEENVKTRKVEQVDFRTVLSPTRKEINEGLPSTSPPPSIAEIPRAKWKRNEGLDNNTVATKRSRNRNQNADKRTIKKSDEVEELSKPMIKQALEDVQATDGSAFQLMCLVAGNPKPEVSWYLDNEEIKPDSDIEIKREGERCMLLVGECLPDDEGLYVCKACNELGEASSTARVTIIVSSEGSVVGSPNDETYNNKDEKVIEERKVTKVERSNQNELLSKIKKEIKVTESIKMKKPAALKKDFQVQSSIDRAKNPSSSENITQAPEKPLCVLSVREKSVKLTWSGKKPLGGMCEYIVEESQAKNIQDKQIWSKVATAIHTTCILTNLRADIYYFYRIIAKTRRGTSGPSEISDPVLLPTSTKREPLTKYAQLGFRRFSQENIFSSTNQSHDSSVTSRKKENEKSKIDAVASPLSSRRGSPSSSKAPRRSSCENILSSDFSVASDLRTNCLTSKRPSKSIPDKVEISSYKAELKSSDKKSKSYNHPSINSSDQLTSTRAELSIRQSYQMKTEIRMKNTISSSKTRKKQEIALLVGHQKSDDIRSREVKPPIHVRRSEKNEKSGFNSGDANLKDKQQQSLHKTPKERDLKQMKVTSCFVSTSRKVEDTSVCNKTHSDVKKSSFVALLTEEKIEEKKPIETFKTPQSVKQSKVEKREKDNFECAAEDIVQTHAKVEIKYDQKFCDSYNVHERLGQGRFGKVHRVTNCRNNREYAAKIMRALKPKDHSSVCNEIEIMNNLRHPKLVQLVDAFCNGREITMVMDFIGGGELFERVIDEDFELTEKICVQYMRQIIEGIGFVHDNNIIHLDLKPENILCVNKTGTKIKIIDFGLARKYNPNESTKVLLGTPEFVSPEVVNFDAIGFPTDMWSIGVICYILLSGLSPFAGDNDTETYSNITAVRWDFEDESFDQISNEAKDFIRHLLVRSMSNRFTTRQALDHVWLRPQKTKKYKRLNTKNLRRFIVRRKWQKTGNAVRALSRLNDLAQMTSQTDVDGKSGFVNALKMQLKRENTRTQNRIRPRFLGKIRSVECIQGSGVRFECSVVGKPVPEVTWYKDGKLLTQTSRYRINCERDEVHSLSISQVTGVDSGNYTCRATNLLGREETQAKVTVRKVFK